MSKIVLHSGFHLLTFFSVDGLQILCKFLTFCFKLCRAIEKQRINFPNESCLLCLKGDGSSSRAFLKKGMCSVWVAFESIINI